MLHDLMAKYGSDKASHGFCEFYEGYFGPIRDSARAVLEIGVYMGASMRAWLDYFPNARILGADDGRWRKHWEFKSPRAHIWLVDQADRAGMEKVVSDIGEPLDVVIDDGGHTMWQQQVSLAVVLKAVKPGGLYAIEDLHSSFITMIGYGNEQNVLEAYTTGCDFPLTTTHEVLSKWPDVKSDYVTQDEWDYLVEHVANVTIFDRDGDHKHMTSVLEVNR